MKPFDAAAFKRAWRAACEQYGIDPEEGATGYQVANLLAERRKAAPRSQWWADDDQMWAYAPPYISEVEEAAIYSVFEQAYFISLARELGGGKRCIRRAVRKPVTGKQTPKA